MKAVPEFVLEPGGITMPYGSTCFACGASKRETETVVIDFERWIEMEGWLRICESCAKEVAFLVGCTSADASAKQNAEIARLKAEIARLEAAAHRVKELVS